MNPPSSAAQNIPSPAKKYLYLTYVYCIPYNVYMPNVTVYIRKGDLDKWKALPNKAAWISRNLTMPKQSAVESRMLEPNERLRYAPSERIPIITSPKHKEALEGFNKTTPIFEHGSPIPKSFSARKKK